MESCQIIDRAKKSVYAFSHWLNERIKPLATEAFPQEFTTWCKELDEVEALVERPARARIALVGTTGAGKSTFLNAVLGQEVLPVSVMQPCTAFVTAVSHSPNPGYEVTVQFCTPQEWRTDLESLVAVLQPGEPIEEDGERGESKRLIDAARKRVQVVYGNTVHEETNPSALLQLPLPSEAERVFAAGSVETSHFDDAKDMLFYLRKLIRGDSPLWPFIKQVHMSGPYPFLAGGLELVDLPGLNDPNEARVEVTREFLRTAPFVWVVFPMVRGITEDVQRILREEKLLRTLVLSGTYSALSLVGTKADDIDTNIAPQLGLSDDCSIEELVSAYCTQTVTEARKQLEQMIRDLPTTLEEEETLTRMIEMARQVPVHTTSASAYIKLKGIARLRKDYGLDHEEGTGIPGVHQHLLEIANKAGLPFKAEMALKRLDQLHDEMAFFFRAKAQAASPVVDDARSRIQHEHDRLATHIQRTQDKATTRLATYRERFLEKLEPLLTKSVHGVRRVSEGWQQIHWATLRAIVQRNGVFKSPSSGRPYDLNEAIAEPLLSQLPVSWERYFTDDLGRVIDEFVVRVTEAAEDFCDRVRLIIELLFHRTDQQVEEQLVWFQAKVALLAQGAKTRILTAVSERRSELAAKIPTVALHRMQPAYKGAKSESGMGLKIRMLKRLQPAAVEAAQPIYTTIQADLLEGLHELELIISGMFRDLAKAAGEQAKIVAHNANIEVTEATTDPVFMGLLDSMPNVSAYDSGNNSPPVSS